MVDNTGFAYGYPTYTTNNPFIISIYTIDTLYLVKHIMVIMIRNANLFDRPVCVTNHHDKTTN